MLEWDHFMTSKWHLLYDRLAYRKLLNFPRTQATLERLETFIKASIGKKYKLSVSKLLTRQVSTSAENYFCSELIAEAYKCLGLLPKDVPASKYWPGFFST